MLKAVGHFLEKSKIVQALVRDAAHKRDNEGREGRVVEDPVML
jgi:hypothetical protein